MATDKRISLLTYLYNTITQDETMQGYFSGTVSLRPIELVPPDLSMPYILHGIRFNGGTLYPENTATYDIDIYSEAKTIQEAINIKDRVIKLLDQLQFNTTEVKNVKLSLRADEPIISDEFGIVHYSLGFDVNLWRQAELTTILGR